MVMDHKYVRALDTARSLSSSSNSSLNPGLCPDQTECASAAAGYMLSYTMPCTSPGEFRLFAKHTKGSIAAIHSKAPPLFSVAALSLAVALQFTNDTD